MMRLSESHHDLISLFEHDLRANASRLSRGKTGSHFSGSCSSADRRIFVRGLGSPAPREPGSHCQAARTELRNLPTSRLRRSESADSDCEAASPCEEAER